MNSGCASRSVPSSRQLVTSVMTGELRLTAIGIGAGFVLQRRCCTLLARVAVRHHADGSAHLPGRVRAARGGVAGGLLPAGERAARTNPLVALRTE